MLYLNREEDMTGADLRQARRERAWTQERAAERLGVTQAYLSMVERGHRPVARAVAAKAVKLFQFPATALPLEERDSPAMPEAEFKSVLGALGYPGYSYLRGKPRNNPAQFLMNVLDQDDVDARVVEALPWVVCQYCDMDWEWLVRNAKLRDRQNRLGFVVTLANECALRKGDAGGAKRFADHAAALECSRLAREDTLCHDSMTGVERRWLRGNRSKEARHWKLLTDLEVRNLGYARG